MAFDPDFGQRSPVDLVQGGVRAGAQGLQDYANRQSAEAEQNRALHPLAQKYFNEVASGRMTPTEAAVAAHSEIDAHEGMQGGQDWQSGAGAPSMGQPPSEGAQQDWTSPDAMAPQTSPGGGIQGAMKSMATSPSMAQAPQEPLRTRDLPAIEAMTRHQAAVRPRYGGVTDEQFTNRLGQTTEAKKSLEAAKAGNVMARDEAQGTRKSALATKIQEMKDAGKITDTNAKLAEAKAIEWQKHLDRLEGFRNRLEAAQANNNQVEVANIRAAASRYAADVGGASKIRSSIPELAQDAEAKGLARELEDRWRGMSHDMGINPDGTAPKGAPKAGIKAKGGGAGGPVSMKFPDGSIHQVNAADMGLAKQKGAVPNG